MKQGVSLRLPGLHRADTETPGRAGSGWRHPLPRTAPSPLVSGSPLGWQRHTCTCPPPRGWQSGSTSQNPGSTGGSECESVSPLPRTPHQPHTFCQDLPINACCPSRPKLVCAVRMQRNLGGEREWGASCRKWGLDWALQVGGRDWN